MALLIKNGRVIDPASGADGILDVLIDGGKILDLRRGIAATGGMQVIDAAGLLVVPGLIDMHTHLRQPGQEYKETIQTGARAAAAGGFTAIACMPNTSPVNDNSSVTNFIVHQARAEACVNVYPVGALTRALKGEALAEYGDMKEAGIVALSDDGKTVKSAEVMRRCLEYAKTFSLPVLCHCEDADLAAGGMMHEGSVSTRLGMRGIAPAAEELIVAREIALAEWVGQPVHIAHVSTSGSVRIIRDAKGRGVAVTAETAPHYFTLTDDAVASFDTATKVNPPLRTQQDVDAIRQGLKDGTLDVIASDHAPHSSLEKDVEFDHAAFGMIGLETSLPLTLSLVSEGVLTFLQAFEKYTVNPARILNLPKGRIQAGFDADITIIDPEAEYVLDKDRLFSKSSNSPFLGRHFKGRTAYTIVAGSIVYPFAG
jgi:dihydroorotase